MARVTLDELLAITKRATTDADLWMATNDIDDEGVAQCAVVAYDAIETRVERGEDRASATATILIAMFHLGWEARGVHEE